MMGKAMCATPPNEVLTEINALFSWNPPRLIDPGKKSSTETRRTPGFYDKHFSDKLVLKKVERLPSLVQDLANNVDKALQAALPTLPPLFPAFMTAERREYDSSNITRKAKNEIAVANLYEHMTSKYCLAVASTLALHPTASFSKWFSLLQWTQSVSSSGYAIMDGELRFIDNVSFDEEVILSQRAAILDTMDDNIRRIFEKMRDDESSLGTWEIKSLGAGPGEVISAVPNLGTFAWTFCTKCKRHQKEVEKVTKVVVGPDAHVPPWSLPSTDEAGPSTLPQPPPSPSNRLEVMSPLTPLTSEDEEPPPVENKRKRGDMSSPMDNAKKRKKDDDDDDDEEEQKAYQDRHDVTAQNIVQQAWAQATRVDGTVIVLHSGNHELVCVRHRASQTLYVSEVIEPHACVEPGYGKLHVGIYVAAIQDAMDRKQQQQPSPISHGGASIGGNRGREDNQGSGSGRKSSPGHPRGPPKGGHGMKRSGGLQDGAGNGPTDDELAMEKMIQEASNSDFVLLYLQYGVYDSPVPALFRRSAPIMAYTRRPTSPFSPHSDGPKECLAIVLTSEIGRGATGVVHRGTLTPEISDGAVPMDVVVKLAFDIEQRKALRNEYNVYRRLGLKGVHRGIATALGFFDDSEDGACALVMLYAGVPLSTVSQCNLSISDRKAVLSTLESIHCADLLHGDIRLENILISESGITIIDFGHSKKSDDKRAKDEELAQLRYFLGLAGDGY